MKPSPIDPLPRRGLFADAPRVRGPIVSTAPMASTPKAIVSTPLVTSDYPVVVKLAAARKALAEIGALAIEPPPLIDATKRRGGRQKLGPEAAAAAQDRRRAYKAEYERKRRAAEKAVDDEAGLSRDRSPSKDRACKIR